MSSLGLDAIVIRGVTIPFKDFEKLGAAVPTVLFGIGAGRPAKDILSDIEPSLLPIIEDIANVIFPGAGPAIAIIAFLIANARPMTQEETNNWMDRLGAGSQS